jgi:hypothetical protein
MKFINEGIDTSNFECLVEETPGLEIPKTYRLKGIFLAADVENKNGRIYTKSVLEKAVNVYREEFINTSRSVGQLNHPPSPTIDYERACIIVESLEQVGNNWIGTARVLKNLPLGRIVMSLIDEKIQLGMSSRGIGSLNGKYVNSDFWLVAAADVVHNPSAPGALVQGILENKEFIIQNNEIVEVAVANLQHQVDKKYNSKVILGYMQEFLSKITG